jgi:hypothetical protein
MARMTVLTREIETLVTHIVARDVAAGVELARSLGYEMPADFDVGVRFIQDGARTRIRMRLNDVSHDSIVYLPDISGSLPLRRVDEMWKAAWIRIHGDALTVAHVWLEKHPEAALDRKLSGKALSLLDALRADPDLQEKWADACRERSKNFTYTPGPRVAIDAHS